VRLQDSLPESLHVYKILAGIPRPELPLTRPHSLRRKNYSGSSSGTNRAVCSKESSSDAVVAASFRHFLSCFLGRTDIDNAWSAFARVHLAGESSSQCQSLIGWSDVSAKEISK
jgi:hypothetical protein